MNITPINNTSFKAQILREPRIIQGPNNTTTIKVSSKQGILDTYDEQIKKLTEQKNAAKELDDFMHSKEIREITAKLPQEDIISIESGFRIEEKGNIYTIGKMAMSLYYDSDIMNEKAAQKLGTKNPQNADGSIDKKGIKGWLLNICDYYKIK